MILVVGGHLVQSMSVKIYPQDIMFVLYQESNMMELLNVSELVSNKILKYPDVRVGRSIIRKPLVGIVEGTPPC